MTLSLQARYKQAVGQIWGLYCSDICYKFVSIKESLFYKGINDTKLDLLAGEHIYFL